MIPLLFALAASVPGTIDRDNYGVPTISAPNLRSAFYQAGYAVAQDRLWQMENSRRVARGQLAEIRGASAIASDTETLKLGYTDEELGEQLDHGSGRLRQIFESYADGVNAYIAVAKMNNLLPKGYQELGFEPRPWESIDSVAIAVMMGQRFGQGGAGELRNYLAMSYLKSQKAKERLMDVMNDIAWQNDPQSTCTAAKEDEGQSKPINFPPLTAAVTESHLKELPPINLLEALPAVRLAAMEDQRDEAYAVAAPFKTGSYAIVVGKQRSATGLPMLLSAPQMGFQTPSIVQEMAIETPEFKVTGLNVPGIPGIIIGYTPHAAWGLTTGVADTQDIFVHRLSPKGYTHGSEEKPIERIERSFKVKGAADQKVIASRTHLGPVILESKGTQSIYSQASSFRDHELDGFNAIFDLYTAKTGADFLKVSEDISLGFNLFFATKSGDTGWAYCGLLPQRAQGVDPRFPTPGKPENEWKGTLSIAKHVRVLNPKSGLLINWNNKPISWWPNLDTPVWGSPFRVDCLASGLPTGAVNVRDMELAARHISRADDDTNLVFLKDLLAALKTAKLTPVEADALRYLQAWSGFFHDGEQGGTIYDEFVTQLRRQLFLPVTGSFVNDAAFNLVVQPSVIRKALEKKSNYPYLGQKTKPQALVEAYRAAIQNLSKRGAPITWRWQAPGGRFGTEIVNDLNRGTFIQIVELGSQVSGRTVNGPGVAESGPHAFDQIPLMQQWMFKRRKTY